MKQTQQTIIPVSEENTENASFPMQAQELQDAFGAFNQLSAQLSESYQQLEVRVAGLTSALEAEQDERINELTEKERVASRLASLLHFGQVVLIKFSLVSKGLPFPVNSTSLGNSTGKS